jgi:hypothetical protein
MALKQALEIFELLSGARVTGAQVADLLRARGVEDLQVERVQGMKGATDFVSGAIAGSAGGQVLGIIGRLGGIGARPQAIGLVSDADGAIVTLAAALKLADMAAAGDRLPGTVRFSTHICPNAPTIPHEPVPFMNSPVDMDTMNRMEVHPDMTAILSVDTTRGNRLVNRRGMAITPTVKQGYVLRVAEPLLDLMGWVTGELPAVLPITTQDITPYGNGLHHVNSILQPCTATSAPVVGVALTAQSTVPGPATGVSSIFDIEQATRFCIEVAKLYGAGRCPFYAPEEWVNLQTRYGSLEHLQTMGNAS